MRKNQESVFGKHEAVGGPFLRFILFFLLHIGLNKVWRLDVHNSLNIFTVTYLLDMYPFKPQSSVTRMMIVRLGPLSKPFYSDI